MCLCACVGVGVHVGGGLCVCARVFGCSHAKGKGPSMAAPAAATSLSQGKVCDLPQIGAFMESKLMSECVVSNRI